MGVFAPTSLRPAPSLDYAWDLVPITSRRKAVGFHFVGAVASTVGGGLVAGVKWSLWGRGATTRVARGARRNLEGAPAEGIATVRAVTDPRWPHREGCATGPAKAARTRR